MRDGYSVTMHQTKNPLRGRANDNGIPPTLQPDKLKAIRRFFGLPARPSADNRNIVNQLMNTRFTQAGRFCDLAHSRAKHALAH
jgi:hypothetical protein